MRHHYMGERLSENNVKRGHNLKTIKKKSKTTIRKDFFSQREVYQWNGLPACIVKSTSVLEFEKAYRHMNENKIVNNTMNRDT